MTKKNFGLTIDDICYLDGASKNYYAVIMEIGYFGKTYKIARCKWSQHKDPEFAFIKYFKLRDLKKI